MPLRPAIKAHSAPSSPMTEQDRSKFVGRRVNFPADDMIVTGYLEPPNPWEKAMNSSADEVTTAYKTACEKHQLKPLNNILQQLRKMTSGEREEILSLKGERLDPRHYDAIEEIFKRIQFTTIDVESTNLDDEASVALFDMIEYYESAKHLNISYNRSMTARGWQACARMLKKTRCLESLNAQNTCLNEHFMSMLCRTIRCGSSLTKLHLENCNMSGRTCTVLMTALKLNTTLKELYLAENKLTPTDALQIGNLFRANSKLEVMDLRNNHIQDAGIIHIVDGLNDQALGSAGGLKNLHLLANQLTFHSCSHLAKAVANTKTLEVLNIGNNNITNEGIFHLRESLMKNRTLRQLGLKATRITCEGAVAMAEYIADNPCIQYLELHENNIKIAGLLALSLSMKVNNSVTRLVLDKDFKKEPGKEVQEQHQHLLLEIMEYCERNLKLYEEQQKRWQAIELEEPKEQLSESVCRLLSLWDNPPSPSLTMRSATDSKILKSNNIQIYNTKFQETPGRFNANQVVTSSAVTSSPSQSPPRIVLPEGDSTTRSSAALSAEPKFSSPVANPTLLSPPPPHRSPPKSRFHVSRVISDPDILPSSAGNTPMPSPVPSPGHTPMPSPGCTPMPSPSSTPSSSPVPSPVGSPISSPCRTHGVMAPPPSPIRYRKGLPKSAFFKQERTYDRPPPFPTRVASQSSALPQTPVLFTKTSAIALSINRPLLSSPISPLAVGNCAPPSSPDDCVFEDTSPVKSISLPSKAVTFHLHVEAADKCLSSNSSELSCSGTGIEAPPNTPAASISNSDLSSIEIFQSEYGSEPHLSPSDSLDFHAGSHKSISWTDSMSSDDSSPHISGISTPSCPFVVCSGTSDTNSRSITTNKDQSSASNTVCSSNKPQRQANKEVILKDISPTVSSLNDYEIWNNDLHRMYAISSEIPLNTSLSHTCSSSFTESDSFVSVDSGLASPDSELSGHQSPLSLSSHSENGDFLSSLENINQIVPDSYARGSLAPPPTPEDFVLSDNNCCELALPEVVQPFHGIEMAGQSLQTVVQNEIRNEKFETAQSLVSSGNEVTLKAETAKHDLNKTGVDTAIKSGMDLSSLHLQAEGPIRSVSDSNLDKKMLDFNGDTNISSQAANIQHSTKRSSDSLLSNMAAIGRFRTLTLAEPSCVRLFGGGVPSSSRQPKDWKTHLPTSGTPTGGSEQNSVINYTAHLSSSLTDDEKMAKSVSTLRNHNILTNDLLTLEEICIPADSLFDSVVQVNYGENHKHSSESSKQESSAVLNKAVDEANAKRYMPSVSTFQKQLGSKKSESTSMNTDLTDSKEISSNSTEHYTPVLLPNYFNTGSFPKLEQFDMQDYEMSTAFREPSDEILISDDCKTSTNDSYMSNRSESYEMHSKTAKPVESNSSLSKETKQTAMASTFGSLTTSALPLMSVVSQETVISGQNQNLNTSSSEQIDSVSTKLLAGENSSSTSLRTSGCSEPIYVNISLCHQQTTNNVTAKMSVNSKDKEIHTVCSHNEDEVKMKNSGPMLTKQKAVDVNLERPSLINMYSDSLEKCRPLIEESNVDFVSSSISENAKLLDSRKQGIGEKDENSASSSCLSSAQVNKMFRSVTVDILADEKDGKCVPKSDSQEHEINILESSLTKPDRSNFCRRASTGSYLGKKNGTCRKRCINMIVDEYIQQQLIELYNSAKKTNSKTFENAKNQPVTNEASKNSSSSVNSSNSFNLDDDNLSTVLTMACRCSEIDDSASDELTCKNKTENLKNEIIQKENENYQKNIQHQETAADMLSVEKSFTSSNGTEDHKITQNVITKSSNQLSPAQEIDASTLLVNVAHCATDHKTTIVTDCEHVFQNSATVCENVDGLKYHPFISEELNSRSSQENPQRFETSDITQNLNLHKSFSVNEDNQLQTLTNSLLPDSISHIQCTPRVQSPIIRDDASLIAKSEERSQSSNSVIPATSDLNNSPPVLQQLLVESELLSPLVLTTNIVSNEPFVDDMCHNVLPITTSNSAANGFSLNLCILEDADAAYSNFTSGMPVTNQDPTPAESLKI